MSVKLPIFMDNHSTTPVDPRVLDAMIPSMTALADSAAAPAKLRRLGFVYMPMGCDITTWTPPGEQMLDELSPSLRSLAPVKQHITAIVH